jgi:hypothetical protein
MENKNFKVTIKGANGDVVFDSEMRFANKLEAQNWAIKQVEVGMRKPLGSCEIFVKDVQASSENNAEGAAGVVGTIGNGPGA